jgi:hypothetical protein
MKSAIFFPKTTIVILDRKGGKKMRFETPTEVNTASYLAFNALLSLPHPVRFHYDKDLRNVTITLAQVEDWNEIQTLVPHILAEHRVSAFVKYTLFEKLVRMVRATISGIAITWCFIAPKVKSFSFWLAPKIKSFVLWLSPKIRNLWCAIAAKLRSSSKRG